LNDTIIRILEKVEGVKGPQLKFMVGLLTVLMCFVGRATYRNLSRYSGCHEKTHSRWSRRKFDFSAFNTELICHELSVERRVVGVIDASFLRKSGKATEGLGKFWNSSSKKAEKGLEVSMLGVVDLIGHTAYTVDARQTVDEEGVSRVTSYEQQVKESGANLKRLGVSHVVGDGYYYKKSFIGAVMATGLAFVGKLRKDADLWWPYTGKYRGRGRPKKYSTKVKMTEDLSGFESCGTLEDGTMVFSADVYSKVLKRKIRVVVLRQYEGDKLTSQAALFTTDLNLPPMTVVEYYKARFQIEFVFRDAKQHTGLSDCQARKKEQIAHQINASLTALNVMKFEDRREKGIEEQTVISIDSWKRRKANQLLINRIFEMLEIDTNTDKIRNIRNRLEKFGAIAA
jgi:hypothetical protein